MTVAVREQAASTFMERLGAACLACGRLEPVLACFCCASRQAVVERPDGRVGARVWLRNSRLPGTVVDAADEQLIVVFDDGTTDAVPDGNSKDVALRSVPVVQASAPEQLVAAASHWQLPLRAQEALRARVVEACDTLPQHVVLQVAEMAAANGYQSIVAALELPQATVAWLETLSLARQGRWREAVATSLTLPSGTFPARLAVWTHALRELDAHLREAVDSELDRFQADPQIAEVAQWLRHELQGGGESPAEVVDGVAVVLRTGQERQWDRWVQEREAALSSPPRLRQQPERLDAVPPAVFDRLVADEAIDAAWLELDLSEPVRTRLAALVAPDRLQDAQLLPQGAWRELVRRTLVADSPLPPDLPEQEHDYAAALFSLRDGAGLTSAQLQELAPHGGQLGEQLAAFAADVQHVPDEQLAAHPLEQAAVLQRCIQDLQLSQLDRVVLSSWQRRFVGGVGLEQARRLLYRHEPDGCAAVAKQCLRLCDDDQLRAEALNLVAASSWLRGDDEAALRALQAAPPAAQNDVLQTNARIAAEGVSTEEAIRYLVDLIRTSPRPEVRVDAARRAIAIHRGSVEDDSSLELPQPLRDALRELVCASIEPDAFRQLLRFLADADSQWVAEQFDRRKPAHKGTPAARLYTALAHSFPDFVTTLAALLREDASCEWLQQERDNLADEAVAILLEADAGPEAAGLADLLLERDLPLSDSRYVALRVMSTALVAQHFMNEEKFEEPAERFLEYLEQAQQTVPKLEAEEREHVEPALQQAFDTLAAVVLFSRREVLRAVAQEYDQMHAHISGVPYGRRNRGAIGEAMRELHEVTGPTVELLGRLRRQVDGELLEFLEELSGVAKQLHDAIHRLPDTPRRYV